ncbi:uncharacterized protein LOC132309416 [Cornus florida]|uniref:uncharacterized protein LOC132309416 n=1 Tax=Cornus florida TaxID=4283 RepID=UPI00289FC55C|nr:uncharacterized protein LOC132309416 [Cornus florida]
MVNVVDLAAEQQMEEEIVAEDAIQLKDLEDAPLKLEDLKADVENPLLKINLGTKEEPRPTVCNDFCNLNTTTPKEEYPIPIADQLVDAVAKHEILSFMDGHSGYNKIYIAEEDMAKTAFRCPGAIGTFKWVVMPFGLNNAEATYQRAMNSIFHDMIGHFMEVYIDDVAVKSPSKFKYLTDLRKSFNRMRAHRLKMNPLKCAFGVTAGNFLRKDYFTKWVEAVLAKSVTGDSLVQFIEEHIIHRFGIPESITANRGKKDSELGKWSPTWDGPYIIDQVQSGGVYRLKDSYGKLPMPFSKDHYVLTASLENLTLLLWLFL